MGFWRRLLIDAIHDNPISDIAFKRRRLKNEIHDISDPLLENALKVYLTTDPEPTEKIEEIILDKRFQFAYRPIREVFDENDIYYHLLLPQDNETDYNELMKERGVEGDRKITFKLIEEIFAYFAHLIYDRKPRYFDIDKDKIYRFLMEKRQENV